ncbi:MAG: anaerobic glycerol-3-phosphate dehydrogenase subunit C, partial [Rubripirellula sp.]
KVDDLTDQNAKSIVDLCFQCHQCRLECPASVDIPKIVSELRAQYVATNGLPVSEAMIGRIDTIAAVLSTIPSLSNRLLRSPFARWIAERMFDVAAVRELPRVVSKTFLRYAAARRWNRPQSQGQKKVAYFVDLYANYFDPEIGRALGEVLQQNGIGLYVPSSQSSSGITRLNTGDVRNARKFARKNVRLLADAVRQGYQVLATEPSALLCLKHEYPNLLDDEDAHLVAENSFEACEYLWDLYESGELDVSFSEVNCRVAYHQPCHLRVLDPRCCAPKLLSLIPGIDVENINAGCSGMAGAWGLQRKNYRNSLRIGWPVISKMRSARVSIATTECSACKMQIEHGSDRKTLHPLKIIAHAYGRMPKVEAALSR